jgi:membrane-bound lytic murein transglycosylase MltF
MRLRPFLVLVLASGVFFARGSLSVQQPTPAAPKAPAVLPVPVQTWTGDFDGMLQRGRIRALVTYSKTHYFLVKGAQRGVAYDSLKALEDHINKTYPPKDKNLRFHVVFRPVSREELLPKLVAGYGDIAVAGLTVTPERRKTVDFTEWTARGIDQIAVTGPGSPAISTVDDLSGKAVFVRKSSSYWESLERLNKRFQREGKPPVKLRPAPEELEDEDLLEMLNAGLVPILVMDGYIPRLWEKIYPKIRPHPEIVLNSGGEFAWAIRKNSPKLETMLNAFVKSHRQGTAFGNSIIRKYTASDKMIRDATSGAERKKFDQTVAIFRKYADKYHVDHLLMMAQGFQESRLDQTAKSQVGAVGVMQVMPETGAELKTGNIHEMEPNIHAGIKYIRFMIDRYYANEPMDDMNKVLFAFAAYNCGPARVRQLRKIAGERGLNPNVWLRNVEMIASEKVGIETVTYVSNIYKYYIAYKLMTEQEEDRRRARESIKGKAR